MTFIAAVVLVSLIPSGLKVLRTAHRVPNVIGERPDVAKRMLKDAGLKSDQQGGSLIFTSGDAVCSQDPGPGTKTKDTVTLFVENHRCGADNGGDSSSASDVPQGSPAQPGTPAYQLCKEAGTEWQKQQAEELSGRSC